MGIPYPSGDVYVFQPIDGGSIASIISGVNTQLQAAGFTLDRALKASVTLTFTGQPVNNQTCAFNGITYTAKTTPGAFPEFGIGATAQDTYVNLAAAIEATNANLDVVVNAGNLVIEWAAGGEAGNGFSASTGLSNSALNTGSSSGGGYVLKSARTPDGLGAKFKILRDSPFTSWVTCYALSEDETVVSDQQFLLPQALRTLHVLACKHQFQILLLNSSNVPGTELFFCVPALLGPSYAAPVIASIANNAGAIEVTTETAHGLTTGDFVRVDGGTIDGVYSAALNIYASVTVLSPTQYVLDGSTWPGGVYDINSGRAAGPTQVSRLFFMFGSADGFPSYIATFRNTMAPSARAIYCFNQYAWNTPNGVHLRVKGLLDIANGVIRLNYGSYSDHMEVVVGWPLTASGGVTNWIGRLWASVLVNHPAPIDLGKNGVDSRDWFQLVNNNGYSLWMVKEKP